MEKNKYLILFYTQYGAISYAKLLKKQGINSITKPVPRVLSSSCGICVEVEMSIDILEMLTEDVEAVYCQQAVDRYERIYQNIE